MARVIVLSFEDNDAAEAVIEKLDKLQASEEPCGDWQEIRNREVDLAAILAAHAKPEALLARPTKGCKCVGKSRKNMGWTRTVRFGWFVCPACRRPSSMVVRNWIANLVASGGNNLLQELRDKLRQPEPELATGGTLTEDQVVHVGEK